MNLFAWSLVCLALGIFIGMTIERSRGLGP